MTETRRCGGDGAEEEGGERKIAVRGGRGKGRGWRRGVPGGWQSRREMEGENKAELEISSREEENNQFRSREMEEENTQLGSGAIEEEKAPGDVHSGRA